MLTVLSILFASNLWAQPVIGRAVSVAASQASEASCAVVANRLSYELIRSGQHADLASKISRRARVTKDDLANIKRFVTRGSGLLELQGYNRRVTAVWDLLMLMDEQASEVLALKGARIRVADIDWTMNEADLPDTIQVSTENGMLHIEVLTNAIDLCLGSGGVSVEFESGLRFEAILAKP